MPKDPVTEDPTLWISIDDFSPGCYSNGGVIVGNSVDRQLAAPLGAADAENTWSCYALPSKSLAALPGITESYPWGGASSGTHTAYLVGLLVHDQLNDGTTEAYAISEYDDGTNHHWQAYSFILESTSWNLSTSTTEATSAGIFGSPYPQFTRVNLTEIGSSGSPLTLTSGSFTITDASGWGATVAGDFIQIYSIFSGAPTIPFDTFVESVVGTTLTLSAAIGGTNGTGTVGISSQTLPGQPVIAFPCGGPASPTTASNGQLFIYPDPATPTTGYGALPLIDGPPYTSVTGQVVTHQNRIIVFAGVNFAQTAGGGFNTNENINYTDPPNSPFFGDQMTVLQAEDPFGYGGAASISAGELFIIKKSGGGVVVTGDINSPNVTWLPGVQPTGNFYGNVGSTPIGLIYCSEDNGAWTWNGGSQSQKISQSLDDGFFLPPEFATMGSNNYGFYVNYFGDKVYFCNNWLYDTRTGGFWTYYPRKAQGGEDLFWVQPVNGNYIYCARLSFTSTQDFLYRFDPATSAQTYQWQSLPFRTTDRDHRTDIREVVVRASCATTQTSPFTITLLDQNNVVATLTPVGSQVVGPGPQLLRFNAPGGGLQEPAIRITSTNSTAGDSPIIHSIEIGYRLRAHQAVAN